MAEESPEHGPTDQGDGEPAHEPTEISYAEYLHPARPRSLRHRPRVTSPVERRSVAHDGPANGENPAYVDWLRSQSMLADANEISRQLSGQGTMWQNPFANPGPRAAVDTASVWFTAYPISLITRPGGSFLATLGDEELWKAFATIGIDALHTGPVKRAGGISGWESTPSVDGHFDRISTQIDPAFGTRRVPGDVRHGDVVRRHGHRRHRARPHRQGCGLPARRDEGRRLPRHLPHGRDRARGLDPPARRPGGPGLGQPRHSTEDGWQRELHHRPPSAGDLRRRGRQGDELERHAAGRRAPTASSVAGSTCTTSRRASPRSTGWTRRSPACAW